MRVLEEIRELIEDELKDIKKKGCITPQELENVRKAAETIMYIEDICDRDMNKHDSDYSGRRYNHMYSGCSGTYRRPMDYDSYENRYSSDNGYSGRNRNRDSMGRYSSYGYDHDDMYSREGATSSMIERLETMLDAAPSDREKEAIRGCIINLTRRD